jgi:glycosyltransferase
MYDALNKDCACNRRYYRLMHSDDEFLWCHSSVANCSGIQKIPTDGLYGDGIYVSNDEEERLIRNWWCHSIVKSWLPFASYGLFKKSIIDSYGFYNLDFKIASDTDWLLRYLYQHRVKMIYLSSYIVKMQNGAWTSLTKPLRYKKTTRSTSSMV